MTEVLWFFGVVGAALFIMAAVFALAIGAAEVVHWLDRRNARIIREREMRRDHS